MELIHVEERNPGAFGIKANAFVNTPDRRFREKPAGPIKLRDEVAAMESEGKQPSRGQEWPLDVSWT